MHPSVLDFVAKVLTRERVYNAGVLEVGSYDVNGSVRPYLESLRPKRYLGVDASAGPSVDRIVDCEQLSTEVGRGAWQIVVSTEMLEHVRDWKTCMEQLAEVTAPGGLLLITTRSPGFPYHPFPEDHWRFTVENMERIQAAIGLEVLVIEDDSQCEGVFALACKPVGWALPALHRLEWALLDVMEVR